MAAPVSGTALRPRGVQLLRGRPPPRHGPRAFVDRGAVAELTPAEDPSSRRTAIQSAFVLTISDGVADGSRHDESGEVLARRLEELGYAVERAVSPDEAPTIARFVIAAAARCRLVVTTGGTGLGPRDVTPQALAELLDYEIPGFGELMRAEGRRSTPFAALSRSLGGSFRSTLVLALPGSPRGALESLDAVAPILDHALATLSGHTRQHPVETGADAAKHPVPPAADGTEHPVPPAADAG